MIAVAIFWLLGVSFVTSRLYAPRVFGGNTFSSPFIRTLQVTNPGTQSSTNSSQETHHNKIHQLKLGGNVDLGYYFVTLYVGNPPQQQTLIIDTGSAITAFPCQECKRCGRHWNPYYDYTKSNSSSFLSCDQHLGSFTCRSCDSKSRCGFSQGYAEGSSIEGFLMLDYATLGEEMFAQQGGKHKSDRVKFAFGCTTAETRQFVTQGADGIIGLGIVSNGTSTIPSLIDFTFADSQSDILSFSLCFAPNGGYLGVGGHNYNKHIPGQKIKTVPLARTQAQYNINVHGVKIGGIETGLNFDDFNAGQGTFLDSGTTFVYAHQKVHDALIGTINRYCNEDSKKRCGGDYSYHSSRKCFSKPDTISAEFFNSFPTLTFMLDEKIQVKWIPENYLYIEGTQYCIGIEQLYDRVILGGNFFIGYDILFDRQNGKVSFIPANCTEGYDSLGMQGNEVPSNETENPPDQQGNVTTETPTGEPQPVGPNKHEMTSFESGIVFVLVMMLTCSLCMSVRYRKKKEVMKAIVQVEAPRNPSAKSKSPVDSPEKDEVIFDNMGPFDKDADDIDHRDAFQIDDNENEKSIEENYDHVQSHHDAQQFLGPMNEPAKLHHS
eukprot:TRINITY_DN8034_c0_g1_i4.p1 TRINITY_DN8034_c0_g1~~TRINITY_DN8034_c0_g1_i4.p1  ORF type:complete len:605 (+),score=96.52 TRINITY_DN8034_c0_g1_i4:156-1970(+)